MNKQPPEKKIWRDEGALDVHSVFFTIQGEGPFAGDRAVFVRLAGCNLQCPQCDTEYTSIRELYKPQELLEKVKAEFNGSIGDTGTCLVVISGGEPFRQNLGPFVELMLENGWQVQIETNGTIFQSLPFKAITVVCSPKSGRINRKLSEYIAAYKYIARFDQINPIDGLPVQALGLKLAKTLARPPEDNTAPIYLQPEDSGDPEINQLNLKAVLSCVKAYGHRLCLQQHKIVGVD